MAGTLPNIVVPANTAVDIYAATSGFDSPIEVGTQIQVEMIGDGQAKLYSGASLSGEPTEADGYQPLYARRARVNEADDLGAFIWSRAGCIINVSVF